MKRTLIETVKNNLKSAAAGIVLLSFLLSFSSCAAAEREPREILSDFCRLSGIEAEIFYSGAAPDSPEFIDRDTVRVIYSSEVPVGVEYAVALHSKLSSIREVGVFVARSSSDKYELMCMIDGRISYLTAAGAKGQSFIVRCGDVIAYGFVDDGDKAEQLMRKLME